jgi:hypothetical protein
MITAEKIYKDILKTRVEEREKMLAILCDA